MTEIADVTSSLPPLTPREVATRFRCSPRKVLGWIRQGVEDPGDPGRRIYLRAERVGGAWRIGRADLVRFVADSNPAPPGEVPGAE